MVPLRRQPQLAYEPKADSTTIQGFQDQVLGLVTKQQAQNPRQTYYQEQPPKSKGRSERRLKTIHDEQ
jgi:hypothetical protein